MANGTHYIPVNAALARAYSAAPKTRQRKVQQVLRQSLLADTKAKEQKRLSKKETVLFLEINRTLAVEQKTRFDELTEKRLNDELSSTECDELESLTRELEQIGVARLRAVIELARLRKVEPAELIKKLELEPFVQIS